MKQTAVEFLEEELLKLFGDHLPFELLDEAKEIEEQQAKRIEKVKEAKRLLFIGKVSQIIGFDKTAKLLKEVEQEINHGI